MDRQIVTICINGIGVAQFAADRFDLDISDDTVTMTCTVPNTQEHPVTIDDRNTALLNTKFTNRRGETVRLADLT